MATKWKPQFFPADDANIARVERVDVQPQCWRIRIPIRDEDAISLAHCVSGRVVFPQCRCIERSAGCDATYFSIQRGIGEIAQYLHVGTPLGSRREKYTT